MTVLQDTHVCTNLIDNNLQTMVKPKASLFWIHSLDYNVYNGYVG